MSEGGQPFTYCQVGRRIQAVQNDLDPLMRLSEGDFGYADICRQITQGLQECFKRWQQHSALFNGDDLIAAAPAETQSNLSFGPTLLPSHRKASASSAGRWRCDEGRHVNFGQATMCQSVPDHTYFPFAVGLGGNMLRHAATTIAKIFARGRCAI